MAPLGEYRPMEAEFARFREYTRDAADETQAGRS